MNANHSEHEHASQSTMMASTSHPYSTQDNLCIYGCGNRRHFNSLYCEFHYDEEHYSSR